MLLINVLPPQKKIPVSTCRHEYATTEWLKIDGLQTCHMFSYCLKPFLYLIVAALSVCFALCTVY